MARLTTLGLLLAWVMLVAGTDRTYTEMQCQTFYGSISPYAVPTHTTTVTSAAPDMIVGFTIKPTTTINDGKPAVTFIRTKTAISTVTENVTQELTGSIFTITSTKVAYWSRQVNITTNITATTVSIHPYNINLQIPVMDGFLPINTTTPTTSTSASALVSTLPDGKLTTIPVTPTSDSSPTAGSGVKDAQAPKTSVVPSPDQIIYIMSDGKLVPTPLSAVSSLISASATAEGSAPLDVPAAATGVVVGDIAAAISGDDRKDKTEMVDDGGMGPAHALVESGAAQPEHANSDDKEAQSAEQPPTAKEINAKEKQEEEEEEQDPNVPRSTSTFPHDSTVSLSRTVHKSLGHFDPKTMRIYPEDKKTSKITTAPHGHPTEMTDESAMAPVPAVEKDQGGLAKRKIDSGKAPYLGMRGALSRNTAVSPIAFPTKVLCTKSYIAATTSWSPVTDSPTFVAQANKTSTVTSLYVVTITATVPNKSAFRTDTYVTTTTISSTTTSEITNTHNTANVYTMTRTQTAYEACRTTNIIGPKVGGNAHIMNVYNHGPDAYTTYDVGHARNAEECCIECHTMSSPCLGSVFTQGKCYLMTDEENKCDSQANGAGFFVTRPEWEPPKWNWPEYVISNGPCGFFFDGGYGF